MKYFNIEYLLIAGSVVVLAELGWAAWTLAPAYFEKTYFNKTPLVVSKSLFPEGMATLTIQSSKTQYQMGEDIEVTLKISSDVKSTGADLVILYDPNLLEVINPTKPVDNLGIYDEYTINTKSDKAGQILFSGISSKALGVVAEGDLGKVHFQPKLPGKANITVDFTKGKTTDTNIISAKNSQDILSEVNGIELNILP